MPLTTIRNASGIALALGILGTTLASTASANDFRSIMKDLANDMNQVQSGLFVEDFDTVIEAAEAIADHPKPPSGERQRVMAVVGPRVSEFRTLDQQVHETANGLADAARDQDLDQSIRYHGRLVNACTACHSAFRDEVVSALPPEDAPER
ncbi:MAG: cytochrome c [Pseudomonadota bacterium]